MNPSCVFRRLSFAVVAIALAVVRAVAEPMRDWDWHLPAELYKNLEFADRAAYDRAVKLFDAAINAERSGRKVTDVVPLYRNAAGEWRKLQMQGETGEGNEELVAYTVFMQGYARQQAHDRNEAIRLYTEILDIYPEQKFVAVPARYMISVVHRELGETRRAGAELEEIVADGEADGHVIYYNVVRSLAALRWSELKDEEACRLWEKIVFTKGKPNGDVWRQACESLRLARLANLDFGKLEELIFRGLRDGDDKGRAKAVFDNAEWFCDINRNYWAGLGQYVEARFSGDRNKSRRDEFWERLRTKYIAWFEGKKAGCLDGYDADGWRFATVQLRLHLLVDKADRLEPYVSAAERIAKAAKRDQVDGRIHDVAWMLMTNGRGDRARAVILNVSDYPTRIRWQIQMERWMGAWKEELRFVREFAGSKPGPGPDELRDLKYEMAEICRRRTGEPQKAVKIYEELNDPPRSLWGLAEALRECGRKKESYASLAELVSMFPGEAPNAVLRMGQWREQDGEKEKAIGCYRRLMNHPKWKETGASSQAHQALERLGIATGGAMTNEVR